MTVHETRDQADRRLPRASLLCLATASLVTMVTETLPAGLLPQVSVGLTTTQAAAGQAVGVYALGSMLAALPLLALTRRRPQRPILVGAIGLCALATLVTAAAPNLAVLLAARLVAGAAAGLLWALAAHYAMAIAPEGLRARALSVAMLGVPVGMAVGTPAATLLGQHVGWRPMLALLGGVGVLTAGWAGVVLPRLPGASAARTPRRSVLRPPLCALYIAALLFEVGHMTSYTFGAQLAERGGRLNPGVFLLVIGGCAVLGLVLSGRFLDASPMRLFVVDLGVLAAAQALLWVSGGNTVGALLSAALWGLALGPATTLAQASAAVLAGDSADVAQGVLVTVLNAGMAAGAGVGGGLLATGDAARLPLVAAVFLVMAAGLSGRAMAGDRPGAASRRLVDAPCVD